MTARDSTIKASTATRVDLMGGTLDLWPLSALIPEAWTVNIAVDLRAEVEVTPLGSGRDYEIVSHDRSINIRGSWDDVCANGDLPLVVLTLRALWSQQHGGLRIETRAQSPAGAGLGGSSALAVALAAALARARGRDFESDHVLVETVQDIEAQVIRIPTGCQDYWGALRGGLNCLGFRPGPTQVNTHSVHRWTALCERMILVYSGESRASARNNWDIFRRAVDGDKDFVSKLAEIGRCAKAGVLAIEKGDAEALIDASRQEWKLRRNLWPQVETNHTQAIAAAVERAGADTVRVAGAGGGGVMVVLGPPQARDQIKEAARRAGGHVLEASATDQGLVVSGSPHGS